jgi:hypothetical protein
MSRVIASLALTAAAAAAVVHMLAILGYTPIGMASIALAFLIGLVLCGVVLADAARGRASDARNVYAFIRRWPAWARYVYQAIGAYAVINFFWFMLWSRGGTLEYRGSQTVLSRHGTFVRSLDASGVRAFHAWELRLFSSYIVLLFVLPALYFLLRPRLNSAATASSTVVK